MEDQHKQNTPSAMDSPEKMRTSNPFLGEKENFPPFQQAVTETTTLEESCASINLSIGAQAALNEHMRHIAKFGIDYEDDSSSSQHDDDQLSPKRDARTGPDDEWDRLLDGTFGPVGDESPRSDKQSCDEGTARKGNFEDTSEDSPGNEDDDGNGSSFFETSRVWDLATPERIRNNASEGMVVTRGNDQASLSSDHNLSPTPKTPSENKIPFSAAQSTVVPTGESKIVLESPGAKSGSSTDSSFREGESLQVTPETSPLGRKASPPPPQKSTQKKIENAAPLVSLDLSRISETGQSQVGQIRNFWKQREAMMHKTPQSSPRTNDSSFSPPQASPSTIQPDSMVSFAATDLSRISEAGGSQGGISTGSGRRFFGRRTGPVVLFAEESNKDLSETEEEEVQAEDAEKTPPASPSKDDSPLVEEVPLEEEENMEKTPPASPSKDGSPPVEDSTEEETGQEDSVEKTPPASPSKDDSPLLRSSTPEKEARVESSSSSDDVCSTPPAKPANEQQLEDSPTSKSSAKTSAGAADASPIARRAADVALRFTAQKKKKKEMLKKEQQNALCADAAGAAENDSPATTSPADPVDSNSEDTPKKASKESNQSLDATAMSTPAASVLSRSALTEITPQLVPPVSGKDEPGVGASSSPRKVGPTEDVSLQAAENIEPTKQNIQRTSPTPKTTASPYEVYTERRRFRTVVPVRVFLDSPDSFVPEYDSFSPPAPRQEQSYARMFEEAMQHPPPHSPMLAEPIQQAPMDDDVSSRDDDRQLT